MSNQTNKPSVRELTPAGVEGMSGAMTAVLWDAFGVRMSLTQNGDSGCWSVVSYGAGRAYGECTL